RPRGSPLESPVLAVGLGGDRTRAVRGRRRAAAHPGAPPDERASGPRGRCRRRALCPRLPDRVDRAGGPARLCSLAAGRGEPALPPPPRPPVCGGLRGRGLAAV